MNDRADNATRPNRGGPERAIEAIAIVALAAMAISGLLLIAGPAGLRLFDSDAGDPTFEFVVEPNFPLTPAVDAAAADREARLADAEFGAPITSTLAIDHAPAGQRTTWVVWELLGRGLAAAGVWKVYQIVRSTREGTPFSPANAKRLSWLAGLVALGGTLYPLAGQFIRDWIVSTSDAADLVTPVFEMSFLPLLGAGLIGVLATVWHRGVELDAEVEGMV